MLLSYMRGKLRLTARPGRLSKCLDTRQEDSGTAATRAMKQTGKTFAESGNQG